MGEIQLVNDNILLKVISRVADHSNVLELPQLPEILKAMSLHSDWQYVKDDAELVQLINEAEEARRNYTSVSSLRWTYEKVLLRYVYLLCQDFGNLLIHRWDDQNCLLVGMTIEQGRDGLKEVYAIRVVKNQYEVRNHEYHEDLTRNVFDAIHMRLRHVDVIPTHFGWPEIQFITHPQE